MFKCYWFKFNHKEYVTTSAEEALQFGSFWNIEQEEVFMVDIEIHNIQKVAG